jgi:hypothetical protein
VRLHPSVSEDEAYAWLREQVEAMKLAEPPTDLEDALRSAAEAMAALSSTVLPDEQEPRFP